MSIVKVGVVVGLLVALATGGVGTAQTNSISLSTPAKVGTYTSAISASVLAPTFCANRAGLTNVYAAGASGNFSGGGTNDLVLGRPNTANYTLNGGNGADCVVGGRGTAGTETIRGGGGTDYCKGNSFTGGSQTFNADCDGNTQAN